MKAEIHFPRCRRCGYRYSKKSDKQVLVFQTADGDFIACADCIAAYGALVQSGATEKEKRAFLDTFKVSEQEGEG